jgi:hypothetical protein
MDWVKTVSGVFIFLFSVTICVLLGHLGVVSLLISSMGMIIGILLIFKGVLWSKKKVNRYGKH